MVTIKKIFLASSEELVSDRREFEIFIGRKNKDLVKRDAFLELVVWEDFLDALAKTRLQDEYNNAIKTCDLFVMLFFTKVGQYTEEEFETAVGQFKKTSRPFVFTYFKHAPISTERANEKNLKSMFQFRNKLETLGHFVTTYKNIEDLLLKFDQQLSKLAKVPKSGFRILEGIRSVSAASTSTKRLLGKSKWGHKLPVLLHTFLGLDPVAVPLLEDGILRDRACVFRLWADSAYENGISATLGTSDGVDLIRIRFTNLPGSLPGDVTIRPLGLKAIAVGKDQRFLAFDIRAPTQGRGNKEPDQGGKALAIAIRLVDGRATQWCYQTRDTRHSFTIAVSDSWTSVYVDLMSGWARFDADGNHYYSADHPDFSVIAAIVIEVGTVGAPRPGPGMGELEIARIRLSCDVPLPRRPA